MGLLQACGRSHAAVHIPSDDKPVNEYLKKKRKKTITWLQAKGGCVTLEGHCWLE